MEKIAIGSITILIKFRPQGNSQTGLANIKAHYFGFNEKTLRVISCVEFSKC
jgi:hypothetical protein